MADNTSPRDADMEELNATVLKVINTRIEKIESEAKPRFQAQIEESQKRVASVVDRIDAVEREFRSKFEAEGARAQQRLASVITEAEKSLKKSVTNGLIATVVIVLTVALGTFTTAYYKAQEELHTTVQQFQSQMTDFQKDLTGAYKDIRDARVSVQTAVIDLDGQRKTLETATKAAEAEVVRLKAMPRASK